MPEYDNNMSGALFKNTQKESDRHPDYRGSAEIDGVQYWVSSWIKTSKDNKKYMSLAFTVKEQQNNAQPQRQSQPHRQQPPAKQQQVGAFQPVDEDSIPFTHDAWQF